MEIFRLFIENGADKNAKTKDGNSPLHYVCQYNGSLVRIALLLIETKARTPIQLILIDGLHFIICA